ncbi:YhgE/Pip domain-containing protein [Anaerobacillus isosaccharinicus]|uniref:X-X-X-Leu-X-X-Gly heptad repeat-containing protein n=2 Tax=Anaerobacillus isosaccharinicus TaxID=1532552 RepID=A0A1S2ME34_9BACI|nr:hypothetical protein [Anaerobacillus isosaccharinicus]
MKKRITLLFLTILLIFPFSIGGANSNEKSNRSTEEAKLDPNAVGEVASKDEVVYGTLSASGTLKEIYVVNMLDVTSAGSIIDFGNYTTVRNLTNLSTIDQKDDEVKLQAMPGWFYYQGNLVEQQLPWDVEINYSLDGKEISSDDLAGKVGRLHLTIKTSKNKSVDPLFYENYTLQVALTLDTNLISNLETPDATVANVGKQRQLTYTVMPDSDGVITLLADVVNFEMEGIDIFAIPLSMAIDNPEVDEMTKEMRTLSDAIEELNTGVFDLKTGVSELNNGVQTLNNGSSEYKTGMSDISNASFEIIEASKTIERALSELHEVLSGSQEKMDLSDLAQLPGGLTQIADGLDEVANGLLILKDNFSTAYSDLHNAMEAIPAPTVTEEEIQQLYASGANHKTIDALLEVYVSAQTAKGTYDKIKEAFLAVETALEGTSSSIHFMSNQLTAISGEISGSFENMEGYNALNELEEGVGLLASNYGQFHLGLISYTNGIAELAEGYKEIDSGFSKIANGTSELDTGVAELYDGTKELADATSDLPAKIQEEIDAMMAEFDKSDFEPVSFVSPKNTNVQSVQFILKTEAIEREEVKTTVVKEEEKQGFWQRLKKLFS